MKKRPFSTRLTAAARSRKLKQLFPDPLASGKTPSAYDLDLRQRTLSLVDLFNAAMQLHADNRQSSTDQQIAPVKQAMPGTTQEKRKRDTQLASTQRELNHDECRAPNPEADCRSVEPAKTARHFPRRTGTIASRRLRTRAVAIFDRSSDSTGQGTIRRERQVAARKAPFLCGSVGDRWPTP